MTDARAPILLGCAALLAACNLAPRYVRPAAPIPAQWPQVADVPADASAGLPWRSFVADEKLKSVVEQMLANNRDLRAALAQVAAQRALYHVQRSAQFPTLSAGAAASLDRGESTVGALDVYSIDAGINSFEIDLFGRLRNLSKQAFEQFLSTEAGSRMTRITLISQTVTAYATYAYDADLLQIARDTRTSAERSRKLTLTLYEAGLHSQLDVQEAETVVAQAESDIENLTAVVAQDRAALELLLGGPLDAAALPTSVVDLSEGLAIVPAGLSSSVLLERPSIQEAEHQLIGANADIGAARAALFPTITLTSAVGLASTALSSLFMHDAFYWSAAPAASVPIIGGPTRGNLEYAKAQRDYYVDEYEKAVQSAFRDVADALARRATIMQQRAAQDRLVAASEKSYRLADAQYRVGTATYLNALLTQRTLYTARQTQLATVYSDVANRVALYAALASE
jgi:multidrug efflux system outer membrane protein